jgi:hypothetical protein
MINAKSYEDIKDNLYCLLLKNKNYQKFNERLCQLVMNCSPPGFFKTQPKMKQIWKWIKQLLTDYMKMKMNKTTSPLDVKTLYDLMEVFDLDIQN